MSGKYALIIGNSEYIDPGLAQLTAPGKDAADFARVLKDKEIGAFDDVKVIVNEPSASVIESIDEFFDQKKPDDMLVLYFSGHGIKDEIGSLYLAFKNTVRSRLRSTAIKSDYIKEAMDQSRSKRQVLILDCCNSGAFPQGTKAELGGSMGMTQAFQGYGRFVLTASDATQFAWEGNKVIGETDKSLFTHFLVKGLEGDADNNGDGRITVDELYDYTYDQISRVTPKQTPTKASSKVEGEIVLRQNMRFEDIKSIPLPDDLIFAIKSSLPFVREGAVRQLQELLKGKNLGLIRSAQEALENIEQVDDSRQVSKAATQALEVVRQTKLVVDKEKKEAEPKIENKKQPIEKEITPTQNTHLKAETDVAQLISNKKSKQTVSENIASPRKTESLRPAHQKRSALAWFLISIIGLSIIGLGIWGASSLLSGGATPSNTKISVPTKIPVSTQVPTERSVVVNDAPAIKTSTPTIRATTSSPSFQLELCSISTEEVCIYSFAPQPTNLVIALIFEQNISTSALPQLTVGNQKFKCEILTNYPDRLYCNGITTAKNAEIIVTSSTNKVITSGFFDIPKYVVPSPTPKNNGGGAYP